MNDSFHTQRSNDARRRFVILRLSGRALLHAGCVLFLIATSAPAQEGGPSLRFDLGLGSVYDNNILRYSDKYVIRFDNREDEGRFHIYSRDDLILVTSFRGTVTDKLIGGMNTALAVDLRRRTYTHNAIKDWYSYGLSLRQEITRKLSAQIGYSYIPEFYIRHYRDDEWVAIHGYKPITFQPYSFKKDDLNGWVQYALFPTTRVRLVLSYGRYFYNEHFTEYDCANTMAGVEVTHSFHKNVKVNAAYEFTASRGDGTADMNPSDDEDTYVLGAEYTLPKVFGRSNSLGVEGEYARRYFTSTHFLELDINHAGRRDDDYRFSASYTVELMDNFGLALRYAWHKRTSTTTALENAEYLADEKDYVQYEFGLELKYTLNFVPSVAAE
jgi:hypothetical protein